MRRIVRRRVDSWLLLATSVGLFGCPLLLDDRFTLGALSGPDAGEVCTGVGCVPPSDGIGGAWGTNAGGSSGSAGAGNAAGTTGNAGGRGGSHAAGAGGSAAGEAGAGGSAGTGAGGAAGSTGQGGAEAACWTLQLTATAYGLASNCIGVQGSNNVILDTPTTLALSHDNGDPCFTGTIASTGWGAVYELTFDGEDDDEWNASGAGVTGFEFAYRGEAPPSSLKVIYKDPSGVDNCHFIEPGTTSVPFSVAHPGCGASGATVNSTRLTEMILAFPVKSQPYGVDFCVQLRALD